MIVKLRRKTPQYSDLTPGQPYGVIGIEADDFRLLNDQGRPYLYPCRLFEVVDPREPDDWVAEFGEDGERYAYPSPAQRLWVLRRFFRWPRRSGSDLLAGGQPTSCHRDSGRVVRGDVELTLK